MLGVGNPELQALEMPRDTFALPLVHTVWLTSVVFTALNAALLRTRIGVENAALAGLT